MRNAFANMSELEELREEIKALEASNTLLRSQHDSLFKQIAQFEHDHKHKQLSKPSQFKTTKTDDDDVPMIPESYFDELIKKYFSHPVEDEPPQPPSLSSSALHIQNHTNNSDLALIESIYRLAGVTAFPINDKLYDTSADALLGLRFDVLCHTTNQFLKPHYIILRRVQTKSERYHWLVFRYTTPAHIGLDKLSQLLVHQNEEKGLRLFAFAVRDSLVAVQYRKDKFTQLAAMDLVVDCDLECRRVVVDISNHSVTLICGQKVELVTCTLPLEEAKTYIEASLVGTPMDFLLKRFRELLDQLRSRSLL